MKTRAVFTKDSFELKSTANKYLGVYPDKGLVPKQRKNYVLGTENKWRYDSFVNWDFFPSIHLPILVYFKETQTPLVSFGSFNCLINLMPLSYTVVTN